MNESRLLKVLIMPHRSEKAYRVADRHRQFVFKVLPDASKPEIKAAVEFLFEVKVDKVSVFNVKGKRKLFGRINGKRSDWKKAYVGLQEGYDINFRSAE